MGCGREVQAMELEAHKEDPRRAILRRYRRGEINRHQADAEARAHGFDSMECHPDRSEYDPLKRVRFKVMRSTLSIRRIDGGSADGEAP